jgi:hypothetical protein
VTRQSENLGSATNVVKIAGLTAEMMIEREKLAEHLPVLAASTATATGHTIVEN